MGGLGGCGEAAVRQSLAGARRSGRGGGIPAGREALRSLLRERKLDVDLLMVLAALGAASIGQAADGAILLFLFSLSNTLQDWAMGRTRNAIGALMDLNPEGATVRRDGRERWCELGEIRVGDLLVLRPGDRIAADEALRLGLFARVWPADDFADESAALVARLAAGPARAYAAAKRAVDARALPAFADALETERRQQRRLLGSADFAEGAAAFRERREARFTH